MAIDFPTSPTTGQTVYLAGNAYTWDGTKWWTSTGKAAAVRQSFTAGAGQTTFTVTSGYFAGTIDVYLNGVKLVVGDDVTASDGSTVVLASGATAGDILEVVSFNSFSIANMLPLTGGTLTGGLTGTTATFSGAVSTGNLTSTGTVADSTGIIRRMVTGTVQATTSGTSKDFTGIPSWARRVTMMFAGVSGSGTSPMIVQMGTSSGVEATGYLGTSGYIQNAASSLTAALASGIYLVKDIAAANIAHGAITLTLLDSATNTWVITGIIANSNNQVPSYVGGSKALAATLDRVRLTTANGTDTFDAGSVNILYEG